MTTYVQPGVLVSEVMGKVPGGTFSGNRRIGIISTGNPVKNTYDVAITRTAVLPDAGKIFLEDVSPKLNDFTIQVGSIVRYIDAVVGIKYVFGQRYDTATANIINNSTTYYATLDEETGKYSVSTTEGSVEGTIETGSLQVVAKLGNGGTVAVTEIDIRTLLNSEFDTTVHTWMNILCQSGLYVTYISGVFVGGAWNMSGALYLINDTFADYNQERYAIVPNTQTGILTVQSNPTTNADEITGVSAENLNSVIRVGTLPGMSDYLQYHDGDTTYDYKVIGNTIDWAGGARRPANGAIYYVSYSLTKGDNYYKPLTYYSYSEIESVEGAIYDNGVLVNDMLLAAKIAFANGAPEIVVRQLYVPNDGFPNNSEIDSALDDMGAVDIEILLTPYIYDKDADIMSRLQQWNTPQIKKERLWFTSTPVDSTPTAIKAKATSMASSLYTTVIAPKGNVTVTDQTTQEDVVIDVPGDFFGAAIAGLMCNPNYDKANPITNQAIAGISYPTNMPSTPIWSDPVMNDMAANGVLLMFNDNGVTRVRHALTTNTTNQMTQELQIRWISVLTIKELRLQLKPYIGMKATQKVVNFVKGKIASYVEQGFQDEIYNINMRSVFDSSLSVTLSSTDIRKIDASFNVVPVGTTTWITVQFAFTLS